MCQFCAQQGVIDHRHVPRQHLLPGVGKAEIDLGGAAVKDVAEQVLDFAHLGALAGGYGQKVAAYPFPADLALHPLHTVAAKGGGGVIAVDGLDTVHHQTGGLLLFYGHTPVRHDDGVFLQCGAAVCQHAGENQQLHGAGQVFHGGERHQGVGLGGHDFVLDHNADQRHLLVIELPGVLALQLGHRAGGNLGDLRAVGVQWVAGQVQPRNLLFHLEQLGGGIFRHVGHAEFIGGRGVAAEHTEQIHLPLQILAGVGLYTF